MNNLNQLSDQSCAQTGRAEWLEHIGCLQSSITWVLNPGFSISCVGLGMLMNILEPQFSLLK